MLDFAKLKAPPENGAVLVLPPPHRLVEAVRSNATALDSCGATIAGASLAELRRAARRRFVEATDQPVIVTGHQPAFIHPGVWAKHVVSRALARALGGQAVNLVVDNDAPALTTIAVPQVRGRVVTLKHVPFASLPAGHAYEQIPCHDRQQVARFRDRLMDVMGDRYASSQLPAYFSGFQGAADASDWVDQAIAGRRAMEAPFGIDLVDRRVSRFCWEPLLVEMITNAKRFAMSHNRALAQYRRRYRIRGRQRPAADLAITSDQCELPIWAYRRGERRRRVYVSESGSVRRLAVSGESIAEVHRDQLNAGADWPDPPGSAHGWMLRPRALTLTLGARLLLADLFIHGVGGAKYDRVTDLLIRDYFEVPPPAMACVSATLHLDLPRGDVTEEQLREQRRALRDLQWNPQRYLEDRTDAASLVRRRAEAVDLAQRLRRASPHDHAPRQRAFNEIRAINAKLAGLVADRRNDRLVRMDRALRQVHQDRIACGREYFFGLYSAAALRRLVDALPSERAFRV